MSADVAGAVRPAGRSFLVPHGGGLIASTVVLGVAYFATARLGAQLATVSGVSAVWPAAGVAVAGILVSGFGAWPGVAVASFLETLTHDLSLPVAFGVAAGQTAAAVAAVAMLRAVGFDRALTRLGDVLALVVLGGFASSLVAAAIGPSVFSAGGYFTSRDWPFAWFVWWVGDAIGVLTVAPIVLLIARGPRVGLPPGRTPEAVVVLAATAVACVVLFESSLPVVFLIFPFALWAALRLGLPGAAMVNVVVAGVAVWSTVAGKGPFGSLPTQSRLLSLQFFNASVVGTSLLLAAMVQERRRALADVRESHARLVEAAEVERRRLERDLHDGAQQRLVSLSYSLGLTLARLGNDQPELKDTLGRALGDAQAAQAELRSLAHGLYPVVLKQEGLAAALESLAEQCPVASTISVPDGRYPPAVEATAYFIVCEALANAAKHSEARSAHVSVVERRGQLLVEVTDDGVGGAHPERGSGLAGLGDRAAALGGRLRIDSRPGHGTRLSAELPCGSS